MVLPKTESDVLLRSLLPNESTSWHVSQILYRKNVLGAFGQ